jgi:hypothetical protein
MRPTFRLAAALAALLPLAALAAPPSVDPDTLPIYDTSSVGALAIEAASRAAADSGRRLFVNFGTNDCAPCRVVNDAIYEEPFQTAFFGQFVPVFVDVSAGSPNLSTASRYGVDPAKGLPAVVLSDESLRVSEVTRDGELLAVAKKGKEAVREWLLKRFKAEEAK